MELHPDQFRTFESEFAPLGDLLCNPKWLIDLLVRDRTVPIAAMNGNGANTMLFVPSVDAAKVITAENHNVQNAPRPMPELLSEQPQPASMPNTTAVTDPHGG